MKRTNLFILLLVFSVYVFAGTVSDKDGYRYKTVKIGKQEWMAENLNYKSKSGKGKNICAGCEDFGRLYTWNSAMDIKQEAKEGYNMESRTEDRPISKKHQGICPTGWHIPTVNDVRELLTFVNVKGFKDNGNWDDSFSKYIKKDINEFIFPYDGSRSRSTVQTMQYNGVSLCEPGYWALDAYGNNQCTNQFGFSLRSSGTGEYRELKKCSGWGYGEIDFQTKKRLCCSEGCAGDHFAMWLADENMTCQDKIVKGRHTCEYVPKAAFFRLTYYLGFLQDIDWEYKDKYASVRCLKD